MSRNIIISLLLLLLFVSCKGKREKESNDFVVPVLALSSDSNIYWINKALDSGNTRMYNKAYYNYSIKDNPEPFLYPAIIMANKHDHPDAYYHVYLVLNSLRNQEELDSLDERTRNLALYYLTRACEKGQKDAKTEALRVFGKETSIPSSSSFLLKLAQLK